MKELIRLYFQLVSLRCGPQDVPASPALLAITLAIYFAVNSGFGVMLLPSEGPWWLKTAADMVLTFIWYFALMRVTHKPERFLQTATAVFGYQIVLTPPLIFQVWLIRSTGENSAWQLPLLVVYTALIVWLIRVNVRIVQAALEWKVSPAAAVVILQMLVSYCLFELFGGPR